MNMNSLVMNGLYLSQTFSCSIFSSGFLLSLLQYFTGSKLACPPALISNGKYAPETCSLPRPHISALLQWTAVCHCQYCHLILSIQLLAIFLSVKRKMNLQRQTCCTHTGQWPTTVKKMPISFVFSLLFLQQAGTTQNFDCSGKWELLMLKLIFMKLLLLTLQRQDTVTMTDKLHELQINRSQFFTFAHSYFPGVSYQSPRLPQKMQTMAKLCVCFLQLLCRLCFCRYLEVIVILALEYSSSVTASGANKYTLDSGGQTEKKIN